MTHYVGQLNPFLIVGLIFELGPFFCIDFKKGGINYDVIFLMQMPFIIIVTVLIKNTILL